MTRPTDDSDKCAKCEEAARPLIPTTTGRLCLTCYRALPAETRRASNAITDLRKTITTEKRHV